MRERLVEKELQRLKLELRKLVKQSPHSILRLLEKAGLDESTYYSWQNGRVRSPTLSTIIPMANVVDAKLCVVQGDTIKVSDYAIMPWLLKLLTKEKALPRSLQTMAYNWRLSAPKIASLLLILNHLDYGLVLQKEHKE